MENMDHKQLIKTYICISYVYDMMYMISFQTCTDSNSNIKMKRNTHMYILIRVLTIIVIHICNRNCFYV